MQICMHVLACNLNLKSNYGKKEQKIEKKKDLLTNLLSVSLAHY